MTTLTLKISDKKVHYLKRKAQNKGQTVEEYVVDLIENVVEDDGQEFDVTKDPVYNIKGRDGSAPKDLASEHDKYLYGADSE